MPRPTSFYDDAILPPKGREWKILRVPNKPYLAADCFCAYNGDRSVLVSQDRFGFVADFEGNALSADRMVYRFTLPTQKGDLRISVEPKDQISFTCRPAFVSVDLVIARIQVTIVGVGRATFRPVWKDSDVSKKILGFVDSECDDPKDEESLVWFAGVLGVFRLPEFISSS